MRSRGADAARRADPPGRRARLVAEHRDPDPVRTRATRARAGTIAGARRTGPAARQDAASRISARAIGRSHTFRPVEEWIPVPVPAIIDADLWHLAQEQLARNRERATRNNTRHRYLLRALLICGRCGRRMIGATDGAAGPLRLLGPLPAPCPGRLRRPKHHGRAARGSGLALVTRLLSDPSLLRARFEESRGDPAVDGAD